MKDMAMGLTILVEGYPGSGLELVAKQFVSSSDKDEYPVYVTTEERDEDIITTMKEFKWNFENIKIINFCKEYYNEVLAKELDVSKFRLEGVVADDVRHITLTQKKSTTNFLTRLMYEVGKINPPFRLVINSLDFFLELYDNKNVLQVMRLIKTHAQEVGGVVLMTMLSDVYERSTQSGIEAFVDIILELESKRINASFKRNLIIKKVRNHPERAHILSYEINSTGILVKPEHHK